MKGCTYAVLIAVTVVYIGFKAIAWCFGDSQPQVPKYTLHLKPETLKAMTPAERSSMRVTKQVNEDLKVLMRHQDHTMFDVYLTAASYPLIREEQEAEERRLAELRAKNPAPPPKPKPKPLWPTRHPYIMEFVIVLFCTSSTSLYLVSHHTDRMGNYVGETLTEVPVGPTPPVFWIGSIVTYYIVTRLVFGGPGMAAFWSGCFSIVDAIFA